MTSAFNAVCAVPASAGVPVPCPWPGGAPPWSGTAANGPFEKELEHIENYLYIQNTRFGNALVFEKDITVTEFQIPPLSVQPLIENAIKYGIRKNGNHGTIRLETKQTAEGICILVKNSGPGFDEQKINPHHSIQNIRSRMDYLLHGTLIIHSQEGVEGTVMELLLPYQNQT